MTDKKKPVKIPPTKKDAPRLVVVDEKIVLKPTDAVLARK